VGGNVNVTVTTTGGNATLALPTNTVNRIIENAKDGKAVFDLSRISSATSTTMPRAALNQLANADLDVELRLPRGTIALDAEAAKSAAEQALGNNITITLNTVAQNHTTLTAVQREAVTPNDTVFNITIMSGTQAILNFAGELTITVPYTGALPVMVWYLPTNGELKVIESQYNETAKTVTFSTDHLSNYVVGLARAETVITPETPELRIILTINETAYTVNGTHRNMDVAPVIQGDRTLVPLRFIAEAMGAQVDWDGDTRTAIVALDGTILNVVIDAPLPSDMGTPIIINQRTMIPLRYVSESLGAEVDWNPDTQTIDISK
jgi:hypothetical protein